MEEPVASQRSCLMKVDAGAFSPMQAHEELEQIYILEDSFLDANGVHWIDAKGEMTKDAIAHGYDLETQYLFYNYRDNGHSDRWGGPDGGAGGFIAGDKEGRCAQWPDEGYGNAHLHTTNE